MDVSVTMLGGFAVTVDGLRLDEREWSRRQAAALVKVLALAPRHTLHREQVMDRLWPELGVDEAAPRLHKAAHFARRTLNDPQSLVLVGETVAFFPERIVRVDVSDFEARAQVALTARDPAAAGAAADQYTGELLPQDRYDEWTYEDRERLHLLYLDLLRLSGRWATLTTVDPTDEEAHLRLIAEMERSGDHRSALRQFERLERALRAELGVSPSAAAVQVRARVRNALASADGRIATPDPDASEQRAAVGEPSHLTNGRAASSSRNRSFPAPVLVGREQTRAFLNTVVDVAASATGRTLFLSGAPGVGKTAVLAWLEHTVAERGWRIGSGVAAHTEGTWPYAPVLEAFGDLCRRHPTLLDGLDDTLKSEIENGLSGREIAWTAQSGHQRLFVAAAELLRLAAAGSGAMLVIDDAHHLDPASLRLIHYLARSSFSERVLLVLAHRPSVPAEFVQVRQSLDSHTAAATHDLQTLTYDDVEILIRQTSPASTNDVVNAVWAASGGLPFSVVELTRTQSREQSAAIAAGRAPAPTLTNEQVQRCAAAAILGLSFDTDEFLATAGLGESEAYDLLDSALSQGLLIRTDTGYEFRHSILRETLLGELAPAQARKLHRQAATALQQLNRSPSRIAHHLVQAGDYDAAVPWMLRGAETSAALGANQEALTTLENIRSRATGPDLARLLSLRADLLVASADAGAVDAYRDALAITTDATARLRLRARLARAATFGGDLDTATIALDGLVPDGSEGDTELLLARGTIAVLRGDLDLADEVATEARKRLTLGGTDEWQTFNLIGLQGLVAHNRGEWFERLAAELRAGAGRPSLAAGIFDSHLCVAEFLLYGPTPYREVIKLADALKATAERSGVLRAVAFAIALRGEAALLMGDLSVADIELHEAADLHRDIGSPAGEAHSLQRHAEVKLALGDRSEAMTLLRRALPLARFTSVAQHLLQRIYGTMIVAAESPAAARALVDHAEAALGINDQCPFCEIMLALPAARACAAVGDLDEAERHLRSAEASARMWEGTAWQAAILETKAHLATAVHDLPAALQLQRAAAELFHAAGQPLDAERCRALAAS